MHDLLGSQELGTFYYLANDPKVPNATREKYNKFGEISHSPRPPKSPYLLPHRLEPERLHLGHPLLP